MLQRPYGGLSGGAGEDARLLAAEAGGPQFIFESPSKHKNDDAGSGSSALAARTGLLALLNRRLEARCVRLGPTLAVWLTAAAICAVYLLLERSPSAEPAAVSGSPLLHGAAAGGDATTFVNLGDGLSHAKASFAQPPAAGAVAGVETATAAGQAAAGGGQDGGDALSYLPDLSAYLPDISSAYQNYTMTAAAAEPSVGAAAVDGASGRRRTLLLLARRSLL